MKKAIVFDFDGTLTNEKQNIWRLLWAWCGDDFGKDSLCNKLYKMHHIDQTITREQWFKATEMVFKAKKMTRYNIIDIAKNIKLLSGVKETIEYLHSLDYDLYIVSGGIKDAIYTALGDHVKYFNHIECNYCSFGNFGELSKLVPTHFDYEGKADFIEILKTQGYAPEDITFIGNSVNDEWVHQTGCKTVCVNPTNTNYKDCQKWNKVFLNVTDLRQILIKVSHNVPKQLDTINHLEK